MTLIRRFPTILLAVFVMLLAPALLRADDAADFIARAKKHLDRHAYDEAIADCDKALATDLNNAETYNLRARAWIGKEEWEKAIRDCDEAVTINPKFVEALCTRGRALVATRKYAEAIDDSKAALALEPKSAAAYRVRGEARYFQDDVAGALADCNRAIAIDPKLADAYFVRAQVAWKLGQHDKAEADFNKALAIEPDAWNIINNLGVLQWIRADQELAQAAAAEVAGDATSAAGRRRKAAALKADAIALWLRGVKANPKANDIYSNLGYAYSEAGEFESAERYLKTAVELRPMSPRPHNNLGRVLLQKSAHCQRTADELEPKTKNDPNLAAKVKQLRGEAERLRNDAIPEFNRAVEIDPTLVEARLNLGQIYVSQNEPFKASAQYRAILDLHSPNIKDPEYNRNFAVAWCGLAEIALRGGECHEAANDLKKALELNPHDMRALSMLTSVRYEHEDYTEGEKCLRSYLSNLPAMQRHNAAEQFARHLDDTGKHDAAAQVRSAANAFLESSSSK